jgi:uncharacterized protein
MPSYFDTSALVKRYDPTESGAAQVQNILSTPQVILTSEITTPEVIATFTKKQREKVFNASDMQAAITAYDLHAATEYDLVQLNPAIHLETRQLLLAHKLRANDAIHIATALVIAQSVPIALTQLAFYTSDTEQAAAARAVGLAVTFI